MENERCTLDHMSCNVVVVNLRTLRAGSSVLAAVILRRRADAASAAGEHVIDPGNPGRKTREGGGGTLYLVVCPMC